MSDKQKIAYNQLEAGYEFPQVTFQVDAASAAMYLKAVGETSPLYHDSGLVPPMAVAASAINAWAETVSFPPGGIHASQDFEFTGALTTKETLTCRARVIKKGERSGFLILTVNFDVFNQKQQPVLAGKTTFLMPEQGAQV